MLAAFDQVPFELHDNSLILGCMSFFVAFVMLFDLADPMARHVTDMTQTETRYLTPPSEVQTPIPMPDTNDTSVAVVHTSTNTDAIVDSNDSATNRNGRLRVNISSPTNGPNGSNGPSTERRTTPLSSPEVVDITKNGNYHRSDSIDFVHTEQLPTVEQPVFERVLMPKKKRPTFQKVPEPTTIAAHNVPAHHSSAHYPSSHNAIMHTPIDINEHDYYSRHQMQQPHQRQSKQQQYRQQHHTDHQQHICRPYHNYGYEDYDEHSDNPPPRYVLKSNALNAHKRYRDGAGSSGEPMMVIRNYSKPMLVATTANGNSNNHSLHEAKRSAIGRSKASPTKTATPSNSRGYGVQPKNKGTGVYKQHSTQRTHCNGSGVDCGSDDEVDFRKMNSAIRPGFVANAAKMWDQRAAEQANELNTIV